MYGDELMNSDEKTALNPAVGPASWPCGLNVNMKPKATDPGGGPPPGKGAAQKKGAREGMGGRRRGGGGGGV